MDWIVAIGYFWLITLAWVAGLAAAFGIIGRLMPCNPGMYWWKNVRAAGTDFIYWFLVPLILDLCRKAMLIVGLVILFGGREPAFLPVKSLPLWQQCLAVLLIQDVLLYWMHRLFHTRLAWSFHAIHHSPKVLDWMSTLRFHPLNNLLTFGLADVAVVLLGFAPLAIFVLAPFNIVYSAMVHANLSWTFGPFRYLFASPVYHRWHHTTEEQGLDKNFASTFPFLDLMFGTFYLPPGRLPEEFGNGEPDFPEGFWGQFIHPFRHRNPFKMTAAGLAIVILLGGAMYGRALLDERSQLRVQVGEPAPLLSLPAKPARSGGRSAQPCAVLGVAISADGPRIVTGSEDGTVKVVNTLGGEEPHTLGTHKGPVHGVAISSDGQRIVSGSKDGMVKVWDGATGREQATLDGHAGAVLSVAISADGRHIVAGHVFSTTKIWDAQAGQERLTLEGEPGSVTGVAISADGQRIITANCGTVKVWDAQTGRQKLSLEGHGDLVYSVAISPDGKRIVSGSFDREVKVWNAATGKEELTLKGHTGPVYSVAINPDGKHIVSGGKDGTVRVWDVQTGQEQHLYKGHTDAVTSVAVSADGERIVSGSRDGTTKVWNDGKGQRAKQTRR